MKEKKKEKRILEKKREEFGESGLAGPFSSAGHPCLFFIILVTFFRKKKKNGHTIPFNY